MKIFISGLINIETTVRIHQFPINYFPIDYSFFRIRSNVSGVAFNLSKALKTLGNDVRLASFVGNDAESDRIRSALDDMGIPTHAVFGELPETPASVVLYDDAGRRQIYCDLKDIQERTLRIEAVQEDLPDSRIAVLCNVNFNRALLSEIKSMGLPIATDVHVLSDLNDGYNRDFMQAADILFLSDEKLPEEAERFALRLKEVVPAKTIVIGRGEKGALLYDRSADRLVRLSAANLGGVVNTVGAGDALFSAYLNYALKGYLPIDALIRAEVFAALKIRTFGASVGFPAPELVEETLKTAGIQLNQLG